MKIKRCLLHPSKQSSNATGPPDLLRAFVATAHLRHEVREQPAVAAAEVHEGARAGAPQRGRHERVALLRDGRLEQALGAAGGRREAPAQQPHRQLRARPGRRAPQALRRPPPLFSS